MSVLFPLEILFKVVKPSKSVVFPLVVSFNNTFAPKITSFVSSEITFICTLFCASVVLTNTPINRSIHIFLIILI